MKAELNQIVDHLTIEYRRVRDAAFTLGYLYATGDQDKEIDTLLQHIRIAKQHIMTELTAIEATANIIKK